MDFEKEENLNQHLVSPPRFVYLDEIHSFNCQKQPSSCRCCDKTAWIWASSPVQVESVRWGMWILNLEKKNVDKIWSEIKTLLSKNELGNVAKVSANRKRDMHFICVYTNDFNDVQDVFRVLVTLRRISHLENDFMDYVTEVNDVEEAVNEADFEKKMEPSEKTIVRMYTSPSVSYYRGIESIQMSLRKIRPESQFGLVAKLITNFTNYSKGKIKFFNPPKIHLPFSSESRSCTYDELVDYEDEVHELNCDKQPSTCYCKAVYFIWAHKPIRVDSHVGHWLIYPKKENVDEIWEKVKNLTAANRLGIGAKVSNARLMKNDHVIFIFVVDSNGIQDFFRVLVTLRRMNILENYFLKYVTKVINDVEETTNGASKGTIVRLRYGSPPMRKDQTIESIRMYLLNLGPESKVGLVAELTNNSTECSSEDVINFYNPPKNDLPFSTQTRPCKYDELVDFENDFHQPLCERQPSTCDCDFVSGIWAHQPISVDSIHGGKWMLFPEKENVDEIWEKVKILTAANRLGIGAKVQDGDWDDHVICVYVQDSKDVQDVFRVLVTLRRNCLQNTFINYKTDDATLQEMYEIDNSADQSAGFGSAKNFEDGQNIFLYFSPPSPTSSEFTDEKEIIQLFKNNIEPGFKRGLVTLVAELEKEPHDLEAKISFYDPPRILHPFQRSLGFVPKNQFSM